MNYFTAGLYGDFERYKKIKSLLKDKDDHLWILGDILDGNESAPWEGLKIADDIMSSPNITLIAGDHEFAHTMHMISLLERMMGEENPDDYEQEFEDIDIPGDPLLSYIQNTMSKEEIEGYLSFFSECPITEMIVIGDRPFYLCHGTPAYSDPLEEDFEFLWQSKVLNGTIDFDHDYSRELSVDPKARFYDKVSPLWRDSSIIISGHTFIPDAIEDGETDKDGLVYRNKKFLLNEGYTADDERPANGYTVLGIDAAGFFMQKIIIK